MERIIITMTTIPNRLMKPDGVCGIRDALKPLLEQSGPPYELHLNVPVSYRGSRIYLPGWVPEWQERYSHFKIFRCTDFGSITKIYPTLQRERDPDTILITADDDLYYRDGIITAHLDGQARYPGCAVGFAGVTSIEDDMCGRIRWASSMDKDIRVRILEGYKTVSYRRSYFDDDLDKFAFAHWGDDVALSAYLGYRKIIKMVLKCPDCTDFSPRVQSYPVVDHIPLNDPGGCVLSRNDPNVNDPAERVANDWFRLNYLEQ